MEGTSKEERQRWSFRGANPMVLAVHQAQPALMVTMLGREESQKINEIPKPCDVFACSKK